MAASRRGAGHQPRDPDGLAAEERIVVADLHGAADGDLVRDGVRITADVAAGTTSRMVAEAIEAGRSDIVNNAGPYASLEMRPFEQIPLDEWRRVMDVNVASMFLTCRAVVPLMREAGGGRIVNISSGTPFRGVPFLLHYVTSKGAIVAFTRALAKEVGRDNVLVRLRRARFHHLGGRRNTRGDQLRDVSVAARTLQRDQVPADVVGAGVFLCGPGSEFITGQTMVIDGGQYFH